MIEYKYSIIVPAYNNQEGVNSIVAWFVQKIAQLENAELIVIDDGSINPIIIEENDSIILVRQKNGGVSTARNKGIDIARGEYVAFLDSDDYFNDDVFLIWDKAVKNTESTLLIFPPVYHDRSSNKKDRKKHNIDAKSYEYYCATNAYFLKDISTHICSILISKKFLEEKKIRFNTSIYLSEDILFIVECLRHSEKVEISNECYFNYIVGLPSATNGMATIKILNNIAAFKEISKINFDDKTNKSRDFFVATMYINLLIRIFKNKTKYSEVIAGTIKEKSLLHKKLVFPLNKRGLATLIISIIFHLPNSVINFIISKGCLRDS